MRLCDAYKCGLWWYKQSISAPVATVRVPCECAFVYFVYVFEEEDVANFRDESVLVRAIPVMFSVFRFTFDVRARASVENTHKDYI